jgi:hypothetical protein
MPNIRWNVGQNRALLGASTVLKVMGRVGDHRQNRRLMTRRAGQVKEGRFFLPYR